MSIGSLRKKINAVDAQLIKLLARRFTYVKAIGALKKIHGHPITDTAREKELANFHASLEKMHGLSSTFTKLFWRLILKESKRIQKIKH